MYHNIIVSFVLTKELYYLYDACFHGVNVFPELIKVLM